MSESYQVESFTNVRSDGHHLGFKASIHTGNSFTGCPLWSMFVCLRASPCSMASGNSLSTFLYLHQLISTPITSANDTKIATNNVDGNYLRHLMHYRPEITYRTSSASQNQGFLLILPDIKLRCPDIVYLDFTPTCAVFLMDPGRESRTQAKCSF